MRGGAAVTDRYIQANKPEPFTSNGKLKEIPFHQLFFNSSHLEALKEEGNEKQRGREGSKHLVTVSVLLYRIDRGLFRS
jgi:hypothetical protein